ncbi:MAG TPA: RNA polymerase sigma factor [Thermoanaerobaculia bacterium]|jgi:RNA polymerase sigma-70 factor (ECF subfamily)
MTSLDMTMPMPFALGRDETATAPGRGRKPMDEARFEAFYRKSAGALWSYIFRLTGDAATADDLLQKAFFRFLRANPPLVSEEHMRRWLFRTATNLTMDHFRETKRWKKEELSAQASIAPDRGELRHDMMRIFSELKPQERALLWLAHVEESSHDEIAETLGLKSKSVRVLLFRARKRLGELLSKKGLAPAARTMEGAR